MFRGKLRFRSRLTLNLIWLIGLSMLGAGLLMATLFERSHIEELKRNLQRELQVLAITEDWQQTDADDSLIAHYTKRLYQLRESTDARLTYVRSDGMVLGDSEHDPRTMDNHREREEIADALRDGTGFVIRYSSTLKQNMLYAALLIQDDKTGEKLGVLRISMSLADVEQAVQKFWLYLVSGMFALFVIVSFVSYRIAKSITRPIEKMTRVAKQIADRNYHSRVIVSRNDEVGQLAEAINQMSDSLRTQLNRIYENEERLNSILEHIRFGVIMVNQNGKIVLVNPIAERLIGFSRDELLGQSFTSERYPLPFTKLIETCIQRDEHVRDEQMLHFPEERLVEINVTPIGAEKVNVNGFLVVIQDITELRRLERMRSEFVANVSHELKTPIASVQGFSETLLSGALDDRETARSFIQIIYHESERLNRLVGDLLDLSKIESKRSPLQLSAVDLNQVIDNSLQMVDTVAENKKIKLVKKLSEPIYLEADEDRLQQILMNLLSNGINYTPEGGTVTISAEVDNEHEQDEQEQIRIVVTDTGIGIPSEDLPRIFERFYRVDKARSRSSGGTGLGLSIVKHLVELHHGMIRVESQVGIGTQFTIILPIIQ